jgi:two-component system chemotaxis sensor kinase CheA
VVRIPLTLAIVEGMLVRVGDAQYTIPILAIRESLRPTQDVITVTPDNVEVVRIREELIPVLRLHELFGRKPDIESLYDGILVVVESQEKCVALFADELLGQQQTVIKGLSHFLGTARGISGCTILGDGRVSLIVDVRSLIEMAETRAVESEQIEDDARAATKAANLKNSNRRTGKKTKAKEV